MGHLGAPNFHPKPWQPHGLALDGAGADISNLSKVFGGI